MIVAAQLANNKFWWYTARSAGIVAWVLCTASVLWGLALSTRLVRRRGAPAWLLDLHRFLGLLSVVFTAVHLAALWVHARWEFKSQRWGFTQLFVIGKADYKPGWISWGIVAFYLLCAVQISSWLMKRIRRKLWHTIHLSSFALFITATMHALFAGSDRHNRLVQWGALVGCSMVLFLTIFRVLAPKKAQLAEEREKREQAARAAAMRTPAT